MKQYLLEPFNGAVLAGLLIGVAIFSQLGAEGGSEASPEVETTVPADTLSEDKQHRGEAFTLVGGKRLELGDTEGAIRAYQQALRANSNHGEAYFRLGLALKAHGAIPMAIRVLRSYIRIGKNKDQVARAQELIGAFGLTPPQAPTEALEQSDYIGAAACADCHQDKFASFSKTAHHLTSRLAEAETINGSFAGEQAVMWTRDPNLWFELNQDSDGFYQTANTWVKQELTRRSERFDIVIGSGKIGQSYLYWRGDRLFQLPISHYAANNKWINSPGFRDGEAFFERQIIPRCLECHTTYFQSLQRGKNIHGKGAFILGISCERCHGPGAEHARFQQSAEAGEVGHIVHPGALRPGQLIEICAQCHSGTGAPKQAPFTFRPGDALSDHFAEQSIEERGAGDVHAANQVSRLSGSKCFQASEAMTCISCHDPHRLERGDTALFSSRCLNCHEPQVCAMGPTLGKTIRNNCIDCHMPRRRDEQTQIQDTSDDLDAPLMPDHRIAIYPEATQRFLARQQQAD